MAIYRSAPVAAPPSLTLACAQCGAFAQIRKLDDAFRCAKCGTDQPTLRADEGKKLSSIRATSHMEGNYDELCELASSVGVKARCVSVTVDCDGIPCTVSIGLNSGSVTGVDLSARTPVGFPNITLKHESETEVSGKRAGVTHEVQTGDDAFDAFIFISSDAADDDVKPIFAAPAVRAAAMALLTEASTVTFNANGVHLHISNSAGHTFGAGATRKRLALLRALAGAPRPLAPQPEKPDTWGVGAAIAMMVAVFIGPALTGTIYDLCQPIDKTPLRIGLAVGLLLALLVQPLLKLKIRGRSDSHTSLIVGRVATAVLFPELAITVIVGANSLFDRSKETAHDLVVESVEYDSEEKVSKATARSRTGPAAALGAQEIEFPDPSRSVQPGQRVTVKTKRGALGWAWRSSPARLYQGKNVIDEK